MNSHKQLEEEADAILAKDMAENGGFDGKILLDKHLKVRKSKEVLSRSGVLEDSIEPGIYHRVRSPFGSANERRRKTTDEQ